MVVSTLLDTTTYIRPSRQRKQAAGFLGLRVPGPAGSVAIYGDGGVFAAHLVFGGRSTPLSLVTGSRGGDSK